MWKQSVAIAAATTAIVTTVVVLVRNRRLYWKNDVPHRKVPSHMAHGKNIVELLWNYNNASRHSLYITVPKCGDSFTLCGGWILVVRFGSSRPKGTNRQFSAPSTIQCLLKSACKMFHCVDIFCCWFHLFPKFIWLSLCTSLDQPVPCVRFVCMSDIPKLPSFGWV